MYRKIAVVAALTSAAALAQLTPEQKVADFTALSSIYIRHYTPAKWKIEKFGFDLANIGPWLEKARATKTDYEYLDVCIEYLASLRDGHVDYQIPSNYSAYLLFDVDIYDGKLLIEAISSRFNRTRFPIAIGDELVSLDGRTAEEWIARLARYAEWSNTTSTRRAAADFITFRPQSVIPWAPDLGETAKVVIRKEDGTEATYDIPWDKLGEPMKNFGAVTGPRLSLRKSDGVERSSRARVERASANAWGVYTGERPAEPQESLTELERNIRDAQQAAVSSDRTGLRALGQLTPLFNPPPGFRLRLGARPSDLLLSGTFPAGTATIGFIRIPSFSPASTSAALTQFQAEMVALNDITSGLVIDIMHNPGGNICYGQELMRRLTPEPFWATGYWMKATRSWSLTFENLARQASDLGVPDWEQSLYDLYFGLMKEAQANGTETGVFPICGSSLTAQPFPVGYRKPVLLLTNEFSASAADVFAMFFQDAKRGRILGMRTAGLGGNVNSLTGPQLAEGTVRVTRSLITRENPVTTPDYGSTRFIENVGIRPDVQVDIMTRSNLLNGGRDFVQAFTDEILKMIQ